MDSIKKRPLIYSQFYSISSLCLGLFLLTFNQVSFASTLNAENPCDTVPLESRDGNWLTNPNNNPIDLKDPKIIKQDVEYDPETNTYIVTEFIGDEYYRYPTYMSFEEYLEWKGKQQDQAYIGGFSGVRNDFLTLNNITDPVEQFDLKNNLIDRLFGGSGIKVEPQGNIDITLGADYQKTLNPNTPINQQRRFTPRFDMDINMGLTAKIGEKLNLNFNYNTNSTFNFDNKLNLKFNSDAFSEDDIIKNIEAGDVSLPLKSSLIQGNQSLFGLKTELQFGRLYLTSVISQQRSEQRNVTIQKGAQWQQFELKADDYDANRHFLLSHYNRSIFEQSLENIPQIGSLFKIKRVEVWVTSINNEYQDLRQIVALSDLGEHDKFNTDEAQFQFQRSLGELMGLDLVETKGADRRVLPDNKSNYLYGQLLGGGEEARSISTIVPFLQGPGFSYQGGRDFEQRRARKLAQNRYELIPELGVLSLDVELRPDEVLAVAYEYTYNGKNYQVGEFSSDVPAFLGDTTGGESATAQVLFLKMLKSSTQDVSTPMWDLMMKNIYAIGAYQASEEDFQFDIYYDDPAGGQKRFLPDPVYNQPLLDEMGLDQLNFFGDPQPDGFFDFVPGVTINTRKGKVMFPKLEPFGSSLAEFIDDPTVLEQYSYQLLYDTTIVIAREYQEKNRFIMKGSYKSSVQSDISLGSFNLPPNSVRVRSGGTTLTENVDYIVDYALGTVKIINDAYLASGAPINATFEDRALFGFNRKSMLGIRADYKLNKKMNIGGTFMRLWERPFTPKVNYGNDPINNGMYGLDFSFSDESSMLTKWVDALPFLETKEKSNVDFYIEGALLDPGHSKAVNVGDDEGGVVYIDDFEGSSTSILLNTQVNRWFLASVPQGHPDFPEGNLSDDLLIGSNRALMNWFRVENNSGANASDPYQKFFSEREIFSRAFANTLTQFRTFDIHYYPDLRGPYNFDLPGGSAFSAGVKETLNDDLECEIGLNEPETRWAGIMREINQTNFEQANVEAIEFWVLNPFIGDRNQEGGKMLIHLGTIAEDVLKDGLTQFENALPLPNEIGITETTNLGVTPTVPPVIYAFSNDESERILQDVGLDGINNADEAVFFSDYLTSIGTLSQTCAITAQQDPANDDYVWFNDDDIQAKSYFDRYKRYNNPQGNSPVPTAGLRISNSYTSIPDSEDINQDGSSEKSESYYEYEIPLNGANNQMVLNDYITDTVVNPDDQIWYRFKIPLDQYEEKYGVINDFRSIRFIRMILKDFEEPVSLRFAKFEFIRNNWRKVNRRLESIVVAPPITTSFDVSVVNVEEHGNKIPFNYILPPGIDQEENYQSAFRGTQLNEQSLSMNICDLQLGDSRGVYKVLNMNMREYERIKMFVHAETEDFINDEEVSLFMRLGSDYTDHYYEYEIPLTFSEINAAGDQQKVVWPDSNILDFALEAFRDIKIERNDMKIPLNQEYEITDKDNPKAKIKIKGNPNLGKVNNCLIGVTNNAVQLTDYCFEVWVNELRLVGFNESGGAAAVGRLDIGLADFGTVALSGNVSTIGWGSIDQQLLERKQNRVTAYDVATNLELGKFLPEESGIKIPFFAQYSANRERPKYDPYDLDIELDEKLKKANGSERDSLKEQALNVTNISTFAFTNVRKERTGGGGKGKGSGKPKPWDIENFSLSYSNTKTEHRDPILKKDDSRQQTGSIDYSYNTGAKYIEPFKKLIKKDKWFKFITAFNFNPLPNGITVRNTLDRKQRDRQFRFAGADFTQATSRQFTWNRDYRVNWNLTKSIKFNYSASNKSAIDELNNDGVDIFGNFYGRSKQARNDYIKDNLKDFGRNKKFTQTWDVNYKLPFKHFGLLDWIQADVAYSANYGWNAASIIAPEYGHSIENGHQESFKANLDFERLYKKWKFLEAVDRGNKAKKKKKGKETFSKKNGEKDTKTKSKDANVSSIARFFIRPLLSVRKLRFNISKNYTTFLPGYEEEISFFGLSDGFEAPGLDFIAGKTPDNAWILDRAVNDGYISPYLCQNQEIMRGYTERWDAKLDLEPFDDFKIDLELTKNYSRSSTQLFNNQDDTGPDPVWDFGDRSEFGSYTISYMAINTLFKDGEANIEGLFNTFKDNLEVVSKRIDPNGAPHDLYGNKFSYGYGQTHQDVILPAFISAYRGLDPETTELDVFDLFPLPNWTLTYNGLSKIGWFKETFSNISISHGYKTTLTMNNYQTDLRFDEDNQTLDSVSRDYYSQFKYPTVIVSEGMNPLIRVDVTAKNSMSVNFEYGKRRQLSLDPDNQQINETRGTNFTAGFGYTMDNVRIGLFTPKNKRKKKSRRGRPSNSPTPQSGSAVGNQLKITCNVSLADDITKQHTWGIDLTARDTRGQRTLSINPAVEYTVNKYMNIRAYFDYRQTNPYTNLSYPITNASGGLRFRFSL